MLSVMFAGGLNLVGDLVLCNGFGMGIGGAAIATVAAQFATCGMLLAAAVKEQPKREGSPTSGWTMKLKAFIPSPASILRLVKFAGPVGLVLLTKASSSPRFPAPPGQSLSSPCTLLPPPVP